MEIATFDIPDVLLLKPKVFEDSRGYFFESFNKKTFSELTGITTEFVQDNQSMSQAGTLRGMHFQKDQYAQSKLVQVVQGSVFDVAVDLREGSSTFGKYISVKLTSSDKHQLFVPRGFAHGFLCLEDNTVFQYKCDNYYSPENEGGFRWDDPDIMIEWPDIDDKLTISEKDKQLPLLKELEL